MARLLLTEYGDPASSVRLDDGPLPAPGPDDVVVEMLAAPLNPADFLLMRGLYGVRPALPAPLGAEGVGRVVSGDPALVGRRVLVLPSPEAGLWADRVVLPRRGVLPVPDDVDLQQLSMLAVNPATAYLLVRSFARFEPGSWIAQTSANSAMGRYVIALARRAGLRTLNVVRRPSAVAPVLAAGGDAAVVSDENLRASVRDALAGDRVSVILDATGGGVVKDLTRALKDGGTVVSYAFPEGAPRISPADVVFRGITLTGFWLMNWLRTATADEVTALYAELAELVASGDLAAPVEATYSLGEYEKAFEHSLAPGRTGKILFTFGAQ
ncbi:zinc-dependent alcohol dehydrogenase family protein [Amycolatopsis rhabdoformis]|uniref:enoyl-[acyl-carrier-protein] reductase n=1 Tax=Amycolatopsis rhabdoformis TaxID=1448059 RepID=A0ABZ1IDP6_9PSEU|nr:zinc-dependent alcohol dehydrogenase family protein [Amycolatopsis rhabdoformis]WSE31669.1 zinc-dependent alcohol dehydrogenase family protein [Amycolatopsis rhabdoformis]